MLIRTPGDSGRGGAAVRKERTSEDFVESTPRARAARRDSPDVLFLGARHHPPAAIADEEWSALDQPAPSQPSPPAPER